MRSQFLLGSTAILIVLGLAGAAGAQTAASGAAPQQQVTTLDDVIVTAQKRSERILDVPISITAVSSEQLDATGGQSLSALQGRTPGIYISSGGSYGSAPIGIRGTTGTSTTFGDEPVALYIDEVYRARAGFLGASGLLDVGSIEIVRGPQGTLQGRNATAGAVLIRSAEPQSELGGFVKARASDPAGYRLEAAVTGPLSQTLLGRLAAAHTYERGWATNTYNGKHLDAVDDTQVRGTLLWTPTEQLTVRGSADYGRNKSNPAVARWAATTLNPNPAQALVLNPTPTTPLSGAQQDRIANGQFALNYDGTTVAESSNFGLKATYAFPGVDLVSITAYGKFELSGASDSDGLAVPDRQGYNVSQRNSEQFTQELRLQSNGEGPFSYIFGLYYFAEDQDQRFAIVSDGVSPTTATGTIPIRTRTEFPAALRTRSYSAFLDATYDVTEALSVSAGVRYTDDRKTFTLARSVFSTVTGAQTVATFFFNPPQTTWTDTSYRVKVSYQTQSGLLVYGSYSTGFKAGGYNAFGAESAFSPEKLTSAELGLKARLPALAGYVAAAVYSNTYENLQIRAGVPSGGVAIINAADSQIDGFEVEGSIMPATGLTLSGNVAYADARFTSFPRAQNLAGVFVNASGNRLPRAPEWQYFASARYERPLSEVWTGSAELTYSYRDRIYHLQTDQSSQAWQGEPLGEVGLRITFDHSGRDLSFGVYGSNLTDDRSVTNEGNTFNYPLASFNRPRTIGVFLDQKF